MGGIIFQEKDKKLELDITGYQYENCRGLDEYDSNWVMVRVNYSDPDLSFDCTDPCLLNFELKEFADEIQELELTETDLIKNFIEPYLSMAITKIDDDFAFQIRFVYEMTEEGWKEAYICQKYDLQGLRNLNNEFRRLYNKFPLRK